MSTADFLRMLQSLSPDKRAALVDILRPAPEPIAIVGMACRFPGGADTLSQFEQMLYEGRHGRTEIPAERWNSDQFFDPDPTVPGKIASRWAYLIENIDRFDADLFGISPREAIGMDPQQRVLLEVAWESLENAGLTLNQIAGTQTGVFMGMCSNDYLLLQCQDPSAIDAYSTSGLAHSISANRISYVFDLRGPSVAIDSACSSSLTAIHWACQSLWSKEVDCALAGGVNIIAAPQTSIGLSRWGFMSPDGFCKAFDSKANGFVRGEGAGIVVLKRLSVALSNNDRIWALIRGSAVNQDGRSSGLTAPNSRAQQQVIRLALERAKVEPEDVSLIETHGTGTVLGDPIEIEALNSVYGKAQRCGRECLLGSVKTNIGHLEGAAGVAGLVKVVLAMQREDVPAHLHFRELNPHAACQDVPFVIPQSVRAWPSGYERRFAGISSFGFGGSNAHLILEAPQSQSTVPGEDNHSHHILCLSGKTEQALRANAERMRSYLMTRPPYTLGEICHTANAHRSHLDERLTVVAEQSEQLEARLAAYLRGEGGPYLTRGTVTDSTDSSDVAFVFPGEGNGWVEIGRELYHTQPQFREAITACSTVLKTQFNLPICALLCGDSNEDSLPATRLTPVVLFVFEYALGCLWRSWGVRPRLMLGFGVGEYVAACLSGMIGLDTALSLAIKRAQLAGDQSTQFEAVLVHASEKVLSGLLSAQPCVRVVAVDTPEDTVIAGTRDAVAAFISRLELVGVRTELLSPERASLAFVSASALDAFEQQVSQFVHSTPAFDLVSGTTGQLLRGSEAGASYWRRQLCETTRLASAIRTVAALGVTKYVVLGPHPTFPSLVERCLPECSPIVAPSAVPGRSAWLQALTCLGLLHVHGVRVDWSALDVEPSYRLAQLPNYAFQRRRYWFENGPVTAAAPHKTAEETGHDWMFQLVWQPSAVTLAVDDARPPSERWVIFADGQGVAEALEELLIERGITPILVRPSDSYARPNPSNFAINPQALEHYTRLWSDLMDGRANAPIKHVLFLWPLNELPHPNASASTLECSHQRICEGVLMVVQSLCLLDSSPPRMWLATRLCQAVTGVSHSVTLEQAPLWGLGRVIALEHPELYGALIDLDNSSPGASAAALYAEAMSGSREQQIAIRDGKRHVARIVRSDASRRLASDIQFKSNRSYLVTGGTGRVGLQIARWLVRRGARTLVLAARCAPSNFARKVQRELEQLGAQVVIRAVDVSDTAQVAELIAWIRRELPPLSGIFHLAGVTNDALVVNQSWSQFAGVMLPKVHGTWNLYSETRDLALDHFMLFSSLSAVLGWPGRSSYAAANAFEDAMAHYLRAHGRPAQSIDWGPWAAPEEGTDAPELRHPNLVGVSEFTPSQGVEAMEYCMTLDCTQMAAMRIAWSQLECAFQISRNPFFSVLLVNGDLGAVGAGVRASLMPQLNAATPFERRKILLNHIQKEITSVLRINESDPIRVDKTFFEMGMDSLMAVELRRRMEASFERALSSTLAFKYPTVERLAHHLSEALFAGPSEPPAAATQTASLTPS